MKKKIIVFEINEGKIDELRSWGNQLMNDRKKEALESLRQEQVKREVAYVFRINQKMYLLGVMEFNTDDQIGNIQSLPIDHKHREIFSRCLKKPGVPGETIYQLEINQS